MSWTVAGHVAEIPVNDRRNTFSILLRSNDLNETVTQTKTNILYVWLEPPTYVWKDTDMDLLSVAGAVLVLVTDVFSDPAHSLQRERK